MSETNNQVYSRVLEEFTGGKDSILEPCLIKEFDAEKMQAKVHGTRSKQTKENVTVMFPSFYLNSGIISFPVKDSAGILFNGPDNETYLFPAQYFLPTKKSKDNLMILNSAPEQFDFALSLKHLNPGEVLLRSLGQAQLQLDNNGNIEAISKRLFRFGLNDFNGAFEKEVERERTEIGFSKFFNGLQENPESEDLPDHHIYSVIYDNAPAYDKYDISDQLIINAANENFDLKAIPDFPSINPYWEYSKKDRLVKSVEQKVNVYKRDGDGSFTNEKETSQLDGEDLYEKKVLMGTAAGDVTENSRTRYVYNQSKEGPVDITISKEESDLQTRIQTTEKSITITHSSPFGQSIIDSDVEKISLEQNTEVRKSVTLQKDSITFAVDNLKFIIKGDTVTITHPTKSTVLFSAY